jgi:serine/threonine protein kinase
MDSEMKEKLHEMVDEYSIREIKYNELTFVNRIEEKSDWETYKGLWNNREVALKEYKNCDTKCLTSEITILSNLKHRCIPKLYGICQEDDTIVLVMEFIEGKKLEVTPRSELTNENRFSIIRDLADLLEYMHSNKVVQRNLAPDIILLDNKRKIPLLFEFNFSRICEADIVSNMRENDVLYMAPESLDTDLDGQTWVTETIDVWAYGCLVSWLFSGHKPWCNKFSPGSVSKKIYEKKEFPIPDEIKDDNIKKLITMCTKVKTSSRWTISQAKEFLGSF